MKRLLLKKYIYVPRTYLRKLCRLEQQSRKKEIDSALNKKLVAYDDDDDDNGAKMPERKSFVF